MKLLGLIPARGGSKGIPRKNIREFAGRPLIAWAIEAALKSRHLATVVVSTEDHEIAEISKSYGAKIPFMRPEFLAQDSTPGIDPILHALEHLPDFDGVVLLQPTSPLRTSEDIDAIISLAGEHGVPSAVSVVACKAHPNWMFEIDGNKCLRSLSKTSLVPRRQDLSQLYTPNGALYLANCHWLKKTRNFFTEETISYVMPAERSCDIDNECDWKIAEYLFKQQKNPEKS